MPTDNGLANIKVRWLPILDGKSGSHFFVQYKIKGESQWIDTDPELDEDFTSIHGLQPDTTYEFRVVAVDGQFTEPSALQDVDTYGIGECLCNVVEHVRLSIIKHE